MPVIHVILNPNARLNRADSQNRMARLQRTVGSLGTVHCTRDLDDLKRTLVAISPRRHDYVVCDGGDGSLHWTVNTLLELSDNPNDLPIFVPARAGTIDFVATKAGIYGKPLRVLRDLTNSVRLGAPLRIKELDTLSIQGMFAEAADTGGFSRIGFALAAGGVGARFFDKYYEERIRGRRAIAKILSRAVGSHLSQHAGLPLSQDFLHYGRELFRPTRAKVTIDGYELPVTEHGALHAGSIDVNFRGLLRVFPLAKKSGVLHFQAGPIMPRDLIRNLPSLYRGVPIRSPGFTELAGQEMTIVPLDGEVLNPIIDGERFERLKELRIRSGPRVRVPMLHAHLE
jgi:diacylglycerol kinase family enzyme